MDLIIYEECFFQNDPSPLFVYIVSSSETDVSQIYHVVRTTENLLTTFSLDFFLEFSFYSNGFADLIQWNLTIDPAAWLKIIETKSNWNDADELEKKIRNLQNELLGICS